MSEKISQVSKGIDEQICSCEILVECHYQIQNNFPKLFLYFLIVFEYHVCYRRMEKVHGLR